jgi:hypothetical protein
MSRKSYRAHVMRSLTQIKPSARQRRARSYPGVGGRRRSPRRGRFALPQPHVRHSAVRAALQRGHETEAQRGDPADHAGGVRAGESDTRVQARNIGRHSARPLGRETLEEAALAPFARSWLTGCPTSKTPRLLSLMGIAKEARGTRRRSCGHHRSLPRCLTSINVGGPPLSYACRY